MLERRRICYSDEMKSRYKIKADSTTILQRDELKRKGDDTTTQIPILK